MLFSQTPIGPIQVPEWEEKKLLELSDEELIEKAVEENKRFCISPAVFAMIDSRFLCIELQKRINPSVGLRLATFFLSN